MTVFGSGESGNEEGDRVKTNSTGGRGPGPERGLEFGARSLPKCLRNAERVNKYVLEQSVTRVDNIGVEHDAGTHDDVPLRWRSNRDPRLRQLLAAVPPCATRPQSQERSAGIASCKVRPLLQAG